MDVLVAVGIPLEIDPSVGLIGKGIDGRQLFVPLSLAVGFAMISSFVLSSTLIPVMATSLM